MRFMIWALPILIASAAFLILFFFCSFKLASQCDAANERLYQEILACAQEKGVER